MGREYISWAALGSENKEVLKMNLKKKTEWGHVKRIHVGANL